MRKRSLLALAAGAAAWAGATFAYASLIERNLFTLRRFDVPVLQPDAEPLRVLHVSDLHMMPEQHRKQEWVAALGGTDPDLVVVTGDNLSAPDAVPAVLRALDPLLSLPGAFVFGSNDYRGPGVEEPAALSAPHREYVQGCRAADDDLRAAFIDAGWADLNNARTILKAAAAHRTRSASTTPTSTATTTRPSPARFVPAPTCTSA
jgi:predicted MPP superfamily phosphohydrolase